MSDSSPPLDLPLPPFATPLSSPPHKNTFRCGIIINSSTERMETRFTKFSQLLKFLLNKSRDGGIVSNIAVLIPYHQLCQPCHNYFEQALQKFIACTKKPRVQKLVRINIKRVEPTQSRRMNSDVACFNKTEALVTKHRNTEPSCFKNNRHETRASRCLPMQHLHDINYNLNYQPLAALVTNKADMDYIEDITEKKLHESTTNTTKEPTMQTQNDDKYRCPKASVVQRKFEATFGKSVNLRKRVLLKSLLYRCKRYEKRKNATSESHGKKAECLKRKLSATSSEDPPAKVRKCCTDLEKELFDDCEICSDPYQQEPTKPTSALQVASILKKPTRSNEKKTVRFSDPILKPRSQSFIETKSVDEKKLEFALPTSNDKEGTEIEIVTNEAETGNVDTIDLTEHSEEDIIDLTVDSDVDIQVEDNAATSINQDDDIIIIDKENDEPEVITIDTQEPSKKIHYHELVEKRLEIENMLCTIEDLINKNQQNHRFQSVFKLIDNNRRKLKIWIDSQYESREHKLVKMETLEKKLTMVLQMLNRGFKKYVILQRSIRM